MNKFKFNSRKAVYQRISQGKSDVDVAKAVGLSVERVRIAENGAFELPRSFINRWERCLALEKGELRL